METSLDTAFEVILRICLCLFFLWLDQQQPFIRHIEEEELWFYRYPSVDSYIPKSYLYVLIITLPSIVFFLEYIKTKNKDDLFKNLLAISLAYSINGIFTSALKLLVGRPRPNFFYRCFPDGVGMDVSSCNGDFRGVMDGRRSFPSAHSSFAFTGMFFLTQNLFNVMDIKNAKSGKGYKIVLSLLPLFIATFIAITRTSDYHHHYTDVVGGAALGMAVAYTVYNAYYPDVIEEEK